MRGMSMIVLTRWAMMITVPLETLVEQLLIDQPCGRVVEL